MTLHAVADIFFQIIISLRSALSSAFSCWETLLGEYEKQAQVLLLFFYEISHEFCRKDIYMNQLTLGNLLLVTYKLIKMNTSHIDSFFDTYIFAALNSLFDVLIYKSN